MAEIATAVAAEAAKPLLARVCRQCGYVMFTDRYVGQLEDELQKLNYARQRVQHSVDCAGHNMKPTEADVENWVKKAETVAQKAGDVLAHKARDVLDDEGRAKKTCFCEWLPNPKGRYCLGRDARKTAQAIQELIPQGKFERVYYESAPPGLVGGAAEVNSSACDGGDTIQELIPLGQFENPLPGLVGGAPDMNLSAGGGGDTITDSRASIFQDIMQALDDEKLKVVGLYGPGGVGKTTLLKKVEEKLRKDRGPFHMIVKAEVLQTPDLNNIQGQIADALKLDLKDKQSQQGRRDLLLQRFQKDPNEKVLIILDDLWDKLDLEAVGIPLGDENRGRKLLLTSRFSDVLQQKMLADQTFRLEGLNDGEAFKLFEKTVGDKLKDEELRRIAPKIVKKVAGLPLLIISVASTLKYSHVSAWKKALRKIDESDIKTIVKLSYDHLNSEDAKSLFLLCGLIGGTIQVETLFVLGMGWGLFQEFSKTMQESRDELNIALESLRSICLLQDGGDDKGNVTIHDLYSEVVVSTSFRGQNSLMMNSNYGFWSKEKLEKCWAICLANVDKDWLDKLRTCRFPDLEMLMLSQPKGWGWVLQQHELGDCSGLLDFTHTKKLHVLYFHSMHIARLPPSIGILGNLHSLYLDTCKVEDVAILGKLETLQILSFAWSTISRLPEEIGKLTNLRLLNLNYCHSLKIIMPGALKGLINLEELHMKESLDQWMGKLEEPLEWCVAGLAELKSLTKLAFLEISIRDPIIFLEDGDLPFENLDKFCINIGHAKNMEYEGLTTMNLNLVGCGSILSRKGVEKNLQKTQRLYLSNLSEFEEGKLCTQGFREVEYLDIQDSPSIKYIADSSDAYSSNGLPLIAFGKLESFFLQNLINLEKICHGPIAPECFNRLKAVRVRECNQLKYLWCLSDVQRLKQLEEIEVSNCDSLQSIVTHDTRGDTVSTNNIIELPKVRDLKLRELPNMISFCHTSIQVSLLHLESLTMVGLLGPEEILYSECSLKYCNLRKLTIRDSKSTSMSILKLDWILKLPNLESMMIEFSPSAEVAFDLEELEVIEYVEILSRLTNLELGKLPNLQCMWKWDVKLQGISILRNLRKLYVYATALSSLFSVYVAKCLREIRVIKVFNCPNMKAMIVDEGRNEGTYDIIEFPLLEYLFISYCSMEKFFSYPCGKKELVTTTSDSQDANSNSFFDPKVGVVDRGQGDEGTESVTTTSDLQNTYSDSFFDGKISLPNLENLMLHDVRSLKRIWHDELSRSSFCKLAIITIEYCSDLLHIFPSTIIGRLHNLQSVKVKYCPSLKSLFNFGSLDSNSEQNVVLLPELVSIYVTRCPSLESLFNCGSLDSNAGHKIILLPKLNKVRVSGANELRHVVLSCSQIVLGFPSLKTVAVKRCSDMRYLFSNYTATTLVKLARLEISKCERMKEVILEKEVGRLEAEVISFPCLSELRLEKLDNLISFGSGSCSYYFSSLQYVTIEGCYMRYLFSNYTATTLVKLERLEISKCEWMKEVILEKEAGRSEAEVMSFPCLSALRLEKLDNLISFSSGSCSYYFSSLQYLTIEGCYNFEVFIPSPTSVKRQLGETAEVNDESPQPLFNEMVTFPNIESLKIKGLRCKELWNNQIPTDSFKKLENLELKNCDNLQCIATSYMWEKLQRCLENLEMISCHSIEIIYDGNGTDTKSGKLMRLILHDLKNLRCIWQSDSLPNIPFPNLRYVEAVSCPLLEMLFPTFTVKFLRQIQGLKVESCENMELIAGHEKCEEATGTAITFELSDLTLSKLPKFKSFLPEKYKFWCFKDFPSLKFLSIVSCGAEPDQSYAYERFGCSGNYVVQLDRNFDQSSVESVTNDFEDSYQSYGVEWGPSP